ncbi:hypothetical protein BH23GEM8_BH23GEM8_18990 [soil metagenome]
MTHPPDQAAELAREVLRRESDGSSDPEVVAAAVESICRKLKSDLMDMLGSAGVTALLGRALNLAKREHPILIGVSSNAEPPACYTGLADSLGTGSSDASAPATAVVVYLFVLLATLLGEELATQPIRKIWPHVASDARKVAE